MLLLEYERRKRRWSQTQVSQLVRIGQPIVSLIERGRYLPTHEQLDRLARAFDLPTDAVLKPVEEAVSA